MCLPDGNSPSVVDTTTCPLGFLEQSQSESIRQSGQSRASAARCSLSTQMPRPWTGCLTYLHVVTPHLRPLSMNRTAQFLLPTTPRPLIAVTQCGYAGSCDPPRFRCTGYAADG